MAVTGTWNVVITRLDKSKLRYSEQRGHGPRSGDILETVVNGRLVKSEVLMFHHQREKSMILTSGRSKQRRFSSTPARPRSQRTNGSQQSRQKSLNRFGAKAV
jgi:hypothetical protein